MSRPITSVAMLIVVLAAAFSGVAIAQDGTLTVTFTDPEFDEPLDSTTVEEGDELELNMTLDNWDGQENVQFEVFVDGEQHEDFIFPAETPSDITVNTTNYGFEAGDTFQVTATVEGLDSGETDTDELTVSVVGERDAVIEGTPGFTLLAAIVLSAMAAGAVGRDLMMAFAGGWAMLAFLTLQTRLELLVMLTIVILVIMSLGTAVVGARLMLDEGGV